jgi:hypothetical protein
VHSSARWQMNQHVLSLDCLYACTSREDTYMQETFI